ncbi:hypothetical protein FLR49_09105 [Campylobacter jejuni]|uniref:hypothetical protein n=1 Tax=Campylobacter sp. B0100352/1 TaxID=2735783 RepID=UPI00107DA7D2|nr:hypothetical protein [Campylobacter lari]EAH8854406.1 hypothetical protein [Campylobacter jejuni]EKA7248850.1 hypothetical protein [Campylobacter coli]MBZ7936530.1 hypothetical protein [Campylobacter sp. B0100352/1]EAH7781232.1 hypothetical protein [Campylobacter lari]
MKNKLIKTMSAKGVKLMTWAKAKGLNHKDMVILYDLSNGRIKGIRGRAKELKEMLEKDGFKVA